MNDAMKSFIQYRAMVFLIACLVCMVVNATAQTEVLIDMQAVKVNAITSGDKPAFTIEGIVVRYPAFVTGNRNVSRTTTARFGRTNHDSVSIIDGRVIMGPHVNVDSISTKEDGDITECVIYARLVDCELPLVKSTLSLVLPLHVIACYRVLGTEGVCDEKSRSIEMQF